MSDNLPFFWQQHAFIVRIWREPGLTRPDGRPLWRGQVQHVASGRSVAFASMPGLLHFIQLQAGLTESEADAEAERGHPSP